MYVKNIIEYMQYEQVQFVRESLLHTHKKIFIVQYQGSPDSQATLPLPSPAWMMLAIPRGSGPSLPLIIPKLSSGLPVLGSSTPTVPTPRFWGRCSRLECSLGEINDRGWSLEGQGSQEGQLPDKTVCAGWMLEKAVLYNYMVQSKHTGETLEFQTLK